MSSDTAEYQAVLFWSSNSEVVRVACLALRVHHLLDGFTVKFIRTTSEMGQVSLPMTSHASHIQIVCLKLETCHSGTIETMLPK